MMDAQMYDLLSHIETGNLVADKDDIRYALSAAKQLPAWLRQYEDVVCGVVVSQTDEFSHEDGEAAPQYLANIEVWCYHSANRVDYLSTTAEASTPSIAICTAVAKTIEACLKTHN